MQYMLLIYSNESRDAGGEQGRWEQMDGRLRCLWRGDEKGRRHPAAPPSPSTSATTVRVTDGKSKVLNGPYAETKEQLGGYFMIECPTSTPR